MKPIRITASRAVYTLSSLGVALGLALLAPGSVGPLESGEKPGKVAKKAAIKGDSKKIPIGSSPIKGNPDAAVTIVEFSDFQCPFCTRVNPTLKSLLEKYPNDVRIVFKHYPLPFHKEARPAAKLAWAAQQQGKFWEMHDLLFENQRDLTDMDALAGRLGDQLGLNVSRLVDDMSSPAAEAAVAADEALVKAAGIQGTPNFLINGIQLTGAQPIDKFEEIISAELAATKKLVKGKQKASELYGARVDKNFEAPKDDGDESPGVAKLPEFIVGNVSVLSDDPVRGAKDAPVTIIAFSDFQCPFCARGVEVLSAIEKAHGKDVRIVFKHLPLSFHARAEPAARLAWAAQQQGKFWEMHDLLFANQGRMENMSMETLAGELGAQLKLDVARLQKDMASDEAKRKVQKDLTAAAAADASGTPTFFVNGRAVVGAQSPETFALVIKEEVAHVKKLRAANKKLAGEAVHEAAVKGNMERYQVAKDAEMKAEAARAAEVAKLLQIGSAPVMGDPKAPVLIYEFTDLQCPFCARGASTIDAVAKKYPGKVAIVSKQFPLDFHKEAEGAAVAALAAGRQGKYWEMRSLIFREQAKLKEPEFLLSLANRLGLDMKRFEADMKDPALLKQVKDDMALGKKVGVQGTPSFFINGQFVVGAQPAEAFEGAIEEQLRAKGK
jgi:protein-disulfide isomerase